MLSPKGRPPHGSYTYLDSRTNKNYSSLTLRTKSFSLFTEYYNLFYLNGVKVIPNNIGDLLTPLGLAHWIMQDGSYHKVSKGIALCTDSFKKEEVELLLSVLQTKFNLICTIQKSPSQNSNRFRIYIKCSNCFERFVRTRPRPRGSEPTLRVMGLSKIQA